MAAEIPLSEAHNAVHSRALRRPRSSSEIKGRRHYVWGFYTNNTYERGPRKRGGDAGRKSTFSMATVA